MEISGIGNLSSVTETDKKQLNQKFESLFVSILLKELHIPNLDNSIDNALEPILRTAISDSLCKNFDFGLKDYLKLKNF